MYPDSPWPYHKFSAAGRCKADSESLTMNREPKKQYAGTPCGIDLETWKRKSRKIMQNAEK